MKYRVAWTDPADQELAAVWLAARDRSAVTRVVNHIEWVLSFDPLNAGESRESSLSRVVYYPPIGLYNEVIPDDGKVLVHSVWLLRP